MAICSPPPPPPTHLHPCANRLLPDTTQVWTSQPIRMRKVTRKCSRWRFAVKTGSVRFGPLLGSTGLSLPTVGCSAPPPPSKNHRIPNNPTCSSLSKSSVCNMSCSSTDLTVTSMISGTMMIKCVYMKVQPLGCNFPVMAVHSQSAINL